MNIKEPLKAVQATVLITLAAYFQAGAIQRGFNRGTMPRTSKKDLFKLVQENEQLFLSAGRKVAAYPSLEQIAIGNWFALPSIFHTRIRLTSDGEVDDHARTELTSSEFDKIIRKLYFNRIIWKYGAVFFNKEWGSACGIGIAYTPNDTPPQDDSLIEVERISPQLFYVKYSGHFSDPRRHVYRGLF